jgi:hypothetical protein
MRSEVWEFQAYGIPSLSAASDESLGAEHLVAEKSGFRSLSCHGATLQLTENLGPQSALRQGMTSVVPHMQQNEQGALAPAGIRLLADAAERSARR